jgi:hypothetical protein
MDIANAAGQLTIIIMLDVTNSLYGQIEELMEIEVVGKLITKHRWQVEVQIHYQIVKFCVAIVIVTQGHMVDKLIIKKHGELYI